MGFWGLVQVLLNLVLLSGMVFLWIRMNRPSKDDPRLSKGLQLLQSKISVLEDLSDRTEIQVSQLTTILEKKCKELQEKIQEAEKQLTYIEQSTQKSLEVASIFQDRIPHEEIIERQNKKKYVQAAKLANQGASIEEILQQVDLTRAEVEMIAHVNREELQFDEATLPAWANTTQPALQNLARSNPELAAQNNFELSYQLQRQNFSSQNATSAQQSNSTAKTSLSAHEGRIVPTNQPVTTNPTFTSNQSFQELDLKSPTNEIQKNAEPRKMTLAQATNTRGQTVAIRPVEFPTIKS